MPKPLRLPAITETAFMAQVAEYARLRQWRVAHFRPARTATGWRTACQFDAKGFPDLVLVRPSDGRLVIAEVKVGRGKVTAEQAAWLECFCAVPGVEVHVWWPESWPTIERVLR